MKKNIVLVIIMVAAFTVLGGCGGKSISSRAVNCVNSMVKGDFASVTKDFDATMKAGLTEDQLKTVWTALSSQVGAFKGTGKPIVTKEGDNDIVLVPCNFEKTSINAKFVFNKSKEISGFWIVP